MTKEQKVDLKIVAVGDGAVGKTCLLVSYSQGRFPEEYIPTVFENYHADVDFEGKVVGLNIYDTAGQEEYDRLRPLCYPETDIFLIMFSIVNPTSLENIVHKWYPELKEFKEKCETEEVNPKIPRFILVGTKLDLREDSEKLKELKDEDQMPVTKEDAERVRDEIDAECYIETSARTDRNVKATFLKSIEVCLRGPKKKKKKNNGENEEGGKKGFLGGLSSMSSKSVEGDVSTFVGSKDE